MLLAALSLAAGLLLNEESSLERLRKKTGYQHFGWMVFQDDWGLLAFSLAWIFAFAKGYVWGLLLKGADINGNQIDCLAASGMYVIGNAVAARRTRGLFFTPWLAFSGLMAVQKTQVLQGALTVMAVSLLIGKGLDKGLKLWRRAFFLLLLFYSGWVEGLWWAAVYIATFIFSGKQSPFFKSAIKCFEKNRRWRVPT